MKVIGQPPDRQRKPIPRTDTEHFGENAKVVLEVALLALLSLQFGDLLEAAGHLGLLPRPFELGRE